jgi:hypothetical protein
MKKIYVISLCFLMIFSTLFLSGCEEQITDFLEDTGSGKVNYINVTINVIAEFKKIINWTPETTMNEIGVVTGAEIKIKVDKASGESKLFYGVTNEAGQTNKYTHSLKLYREQPVNLYANLYSEVPDELKNYTINSAYIQITWEEIHAKADFGENYETTRYLEIMAYTPGFFG